MKADLLRQTNQNVSSLDIGQAGTWESKQNPISFEMERLWVPITDDDPDTPEVEAYSIPCIVRSMISYTATRGGGIRQDFGQDYTNIELARMTFPANYTITQRDKITNIRNADGVLWVDEEFETPRATVFDVAGVIPIFDPFNNHVENMALLQRTQVQ